VAVDLGDRDARVSRRGPDADDEDTRNGGLSVTERMRTLLVTIAAVVVPVGVAAGLVPVRGNISAATAALALAIVVSLVAAFGTRVTGVIAAVSAALSFDFFFTRPYGSLSISTAQEIETAALMLFGGLVVGQLSARNRSNRGRVVQTGADLARIQGIAEMMAGGASAGDVVAAVGDELQRLLGLRSCRFETTFPETPSPTIERSGDVSWGHFWWGFPTLGLPGKEISLAVEHQHMRLGRFVLLAEAGTKVTRNQLVAAVTLADQAGTALGSSPRGLGGDDSSPARIALTDR
jgi:hypothetical protein